MRETHRPIEPARPQTKGQAKRRQRRRLLRATLVGSALTPGLAQACGGMNELILPVAMVLSSLLWVLVLTLILVLAANLAARQLPWPRWLGLSGRARWGHIGAGVATLSLAVFAIAAMPAFREVFANFGNDLPAPTLLAFQLIWLWPLALPAWALGLARAPWRQRPAWSMSWAVICTLLLGLLAGSMYLPIFTLGCTV